MNDSFLGEKRNPYFCSFWHVSRHSRERLWEQQRTQRGDLDPKLPPSTIHTSLYITLSEPRNSTGPRFLPLSISYAPCKASILWHYEKRRGISKSADRWHSKKKQYSYGAIKAIQSPKSKGDNLYLWNLAHNMGAIIALSNSYKTPKPAVLGKSLNLSGSQLPQSSSGLWGLTPSESMSLRWFCINHVALFPLL